MPNPFVAPPPFARNLPNSLLDSSLPANPSPSAPPPAPPVRLARPSIGKALQPIPIFSVSSSSVPIQVLKSNPNRVAAIVQNFAAAGDLVVGGADGGLPEVQSARARGLRLRAGESVTLEITGEIWVLSLTGAAVVGGGVEIVTDIPQ